MTTPAVDQIWQDCDPRSPERYLRITEVGTLRVTVRRVAWNSRDNIAVDLPGVRATHISLTRLRPTRTGYQYVGEARTS